MGVVDNPFELTVGKDGRICVSQEVVVYTREENDRIRAAFERLTSDNAKLRELVANYSAAAKYLCGHSHCNECNLDCASVFDDVPSGWDCARMLLDERARELGIEVDA